MNSLSRWTGSGRETSGFNRDMVDDEPVMSLEDMLERDPVIQHERIVREFKFFISSL
jgi:hypothetical protein